MRDAVIALLVAIPVAITGCAIRGDWKEIRNDGPLLSENRTARLFRSCRSGGPMSDAPRCDYAFLDQYGEFVDIRRDIRDVIDDYLAQIPFLVDWATEKQRYGYSAPKTRQPFPYRIHILTISPVVVLAVPASDKPPPCYGNEMFSVGCWQAARFHPVPYLYKGSPRVVEGSFWFIPSSSKAVTWLPNGVKSYRIPLGDSELSLHEENGHWAVQRLQSGGSK